MLVALVLLAVILAAFTTLTAGSMRAARVSASAGRVAAARPAPPLQPPFTYSWLARHPSPDLGVTAQAGIVVDLDTGRVLWARDESSQRAPASLTKMVTAMIAFDHASMTRVLTVPADAATMEPDVMGLSAGERMTVRDLLYGLFLDSGNDAAETLAQGILKRNVFIREMNLRVARLGLAHTRFKNPTGLDEEGHLSSAYDLAVIGAYLVRAYPDLAAIAATRHADIPATAGHKAFHPDSLNKMLTIYPGATGLKTGLTDDAGGCVVTVASRGGRHLLSVVMHSDLFFTESATLLDYGFATV